MAQTAPVIRLDKSRPIQEVHGDRTPIDPLYRVHYFQNGLPFDSNGILVPPDDTKTEPFQAVTEAGTVLFHPLYTPKMREALAKRLERATKGSAAPLPPEEVDDDSDDHDKQAASDEVNLESWLRGEANYEPFLIFAACKKRFSRQHTSLRSVVEDLVLDEKVVPEDQVARPLLRLLNPQG